MNTKHSPGEARHGNNARPKIRTVDLRVAIEEPNLSKTVREAFDLAKSAGHELDLTFTLSSRSSHRRTLEIMNPAQLSVAD
jgi:hypothetical protein